MSRLEIIFFCTLLRPYVIPRGSAIIAEKLPSHSYPQIRTYFAAEAAQGCLLAICAHLPRRCEQGRLRLEHMRRIARCQLR